MTETGFQLTRLVLTGPGVRDAEVSFRNGLNVISGPSDTGKTFIAQCIDYALGASRQPKEIPEARPYDSVLLGLRARGDTSEITLERSLRGGDIRLRAIGREDRILHAKHQAGEIDTLSHFLLELSGLAGRRVRTNKLGTTRTLSFRDVSKLILVDEASIISERSPIFTGQHITRTCETNVFRLMITGIDDSSVIAADDPRAAKGKNDGKAEVLEALIERTRGQIAELTPDGDSTAFRDRLVRAEALLDSASKELTAEKEALAPLEERRRSMLASLRQVESRMNVLSQLHGRFELLEKQYSSDLARLETTSEAASRLGQMEEERCPVCGARAEYQDRQHQRLDATPNEVATACIAEANKIRTLQADLRTTLRDNMAEVEHLDGDFSAKRAELEALDDEIRNHSQPRLQAALETLRERQSEVENCRRVVELYDLIAELQSMLAQVEEVGLARPVVDGERPLIGADEAEQFSKEVERLLRAWHFPNLDRVTFSERDQDLVISGERRSSHGKGMRAITHAAFSLGLLKYCRTRSMPHPGVVVIDSPLVVYREPEANEVDFPLGVKDAFYRSLAIEFSSSQVIILENEDPPSDGSLDAGITRFTRTSNGRFGFILASAQSMP